jgi:hypothetical protein
MAYSDSAADRLAAVRAAIDRCLTSQAYSIADRRQQSANLRDLRALEKELQAEADASSSSTGGFSVGQLELP